MRLSSSSSSSFCQWQILVPVLLFLILLCNAKWNPESGGESMEWLGENVLLNGGTCVHPTLMIPMNPDNWVEICTLCYLGFPVLTSTCTICTGWKL
jgi:hypothetical protein